MYLSRGLLLGIGFISALCGGNGGLLPLFLARVARWVPCWCEGVTLFVEAGRRVPASVLPVGLLLGPFLEFPEDLPIEDLSLLGRVDRQIHQRLIGSGNDVRSIGQTPP